jgi:hypothetical protein
MFSDLSFHKILFSLTLKNIEMKNWTDFDFHRNNFFPTLCKLNLIKWVEVDTKKYDKICSNSEQFARMSVLRSSKYGHRAFIKCFPSPSTCQECYKYFCICCNSGTNCMYGEKCLNRRCSNTINRYYPEIYKIDSESKWVFMYGIPVISINEEKPAFCSKEIYGY